MSRPQSCIGNFGRKPEIASATRAFQALKKPHFVGAASGTGVLSSYGFLSLEALNVQR